VHTFQDEEYDFFRSEFQTSIHRVHNCITPSSQALKLLCERRLQPISTNCIVQADEILSINRAKFSECYTAGIGATR
jgi:hypothetical protein